MNLGLISVRYATALLDFALESSSQDKVYEEAKTLARSFSATNKLYEALDNPVISAADKKKLILTAAGGKVSSVFQSFVDLVLKNNRESELQSMALKYIDLYRKKKNILYGKLTTAIEVDKATEERLVALVEKQISGTIELEKVVDPSILGGFLMEVDFVRWDASLKNQLTKIKNEYIERNRRIV
ncbi:ATP synthase subunit delta [uncultured Paludibacter sp.]|uniref:ATP synthase subunit delta n=1 Tax=uncultured Paludibacter sp. TaxID=497635 RepID=A0A653ADD5_9BACT|nr:ATP synthase subunit delta [uncultured Paludibacter sp.]